MWMWMQFYSSDRKKGLKLYLFRRNNSLLLSYFIYPIYPYMNKLHKVMNSFSSSFHRTNLFLVLQRIVPTSYYMMFYFYSSYSVLYGILLLFLLQCTLWNSTSIPVTVYSMEFCFYPCYSVVCTLWNYISIPVKVYSVEFYFVSCYSAHCRLKAQYKIDR